MSKAQNAAAAGNTLDMERPWTLPETSAFLREAQRSTRRRIARGELPVIRLPGSRRLLFDPRAVRRFVASNTR